MNENFSDELSQLCKKYNVIIIPGQAEVEGFLLIEERNTELNKREYGDKSISYIIRRAAGFGGFFYLEMVTS